MSDVPEDGGGHAPATPDPGRPPLRSVHLIRRDGVVYVVPGLASSATTTNAAAREPFPLPRMPNSLADWLSQLGESFWRRHRRCVGLLLLLGLETRTWGFGIPRQRCGADASCWSARRGSVAGAAPDAAIAGTFQTRVLSNGGDGDVHGAETPADAVPPVPGVHLVHVIEGDHPRPVWSFLRVGDETRAVPPPAILFDDLEMTLAACAARAEFA